ncbi:F-box/WD repeat-containing protein 12 isoform X2 [Lemur catta]|uniref:F-box/WD repeat-containing protein 12 isoform X2 n=1 Tax=Lemur catta TaxID=9447 RepID=UPI001E26B397|nr:F-box/WD repeat-containing protein 12 isoform X2 [Lemur catta]
MSQGRHIHVASRFPTPIIWIWPQGRGQSGGQAGGPHTCSLFLSEPDGLHVEILTSTADFGLAFKFRASWRGEEIGCGFQPCKMEIQLPDVPVALIFSFLDAFSLLQVSRVNKCWNRIADSDHLWRTLCLKRWGFCDLTSKRLGTQTWKQFFLRQIKEERQMALAQPDDFICKEVTADLGVFEEVAYLSANGFTMDGQKKSVVCVVSSKHTLYTWDVQEGAMMWSSPAQESSIVYLATIPQMHLAITLDIEGTIKVWNCQDRDALAAFVMPWTCASMEAHFSKDGSFLMVGNSEGDIYTFTVPELKNISKVNAFQHSVDLLHCSPDKKWIFAGGIHQHIFSKVFFTDSLLKPSEDSIPLSLEFPCASCYRACWTPRMESRITLMFRKETTKTTGFATFDLATESAEGQTVIRVHVQSPLWMGASAENLIVFSSGPYLFLFTINGLLLQQFEHHQETIVDLWVDSLHVLTTSLDDSLHVYMWEEEGRYPYLKSCCHLGHMQHDQPLPSRYISKAICDNVSIAHVVSKRGKFSNLVMYSLHM